MEETEIIGKNAEHKMSSIDVVKQEVIDLDRTTYTKMYDIESRVSKI
jgi:hypothetical protein